MSYENSVAIIAGQAPRQRLWLSLGSLGHITFMRLFGKSSIEKQGDKVARHAEEVAIQAKEVVSTSRAHQRQNAEYFEKVRERGEQRNEVVRQLQEMQRQNLERHAKLLDKWEEQAQRMDAILKKWEQMR